MEFYKPKVDVEVVRTTAQMTMKVKPGFAVYFPVDIANLLGLRGVFHNNPSETEVLTINVYPKVCMLNFIISWYYVLM